MMAIRIFETCTHMADAFSGGGYLCGWS
jgi:hypothetical protein